MLRGSVAKTKPLLLPKIHEFIHFMTEDSSSGSGNCEPTDVIRTKGKAENYDAYTEMVADENICFEKDFVFLFFFGLLNGLPIEV